MIIFQAHFVCFKSVFLTPVSTRLAVSIGPTLSGKRIALLGFSFKADSGDTRETPALDVIKHLLDERAKIAIYDPQVSAEQIFADLAEYHVVPADMDAATLAQHVMVCGAFCARALLCLSSFDLFSSFCQHCCPCFCVQWLCAFETWHSGNRACVYDIY